MLLLHLNRHTLKEGEKIEAEAQENVRKEANGSITTCVRSKALRSFPCLESHKNNQFRVNLNGKIEKKRVEARKRIKLVTKSFNVRRVVDPNMLSSSE